MGSTAVVAARLTGRAGRGLLDATGLAAGAGQAVASALVAAPALLPRAVATATATATALVTAPRTPPAPAAAADRGRWPALPRLPLAPVPPPGGNPSMGVAVHAVTPIGVWSLSWSRR